MKGRGKGGEEKDNLFVLFVLAKMIDYTRFRKTRITRAM